MPDRFGLARPVPVPSVIDACAACLFSSATAARRRSCSTRSPRGSRSCAMASMIGASGQPRVRARRRAPVHAHMAVVGARAGSTPRRSDDVSCRPCVCLCNSYVDPVMITQKVIQGVYPGVGTSELDELAAQTGERWSACRADVRTMFRVAPAAKRVAHGAIQAARLARDARARGARRAGRARHGDWAVPACSALTQNHHLASARAARACSPPRRPTGRARPARSRVHVDAAPRFLEARGADLGLEPAQGHEQALLGQRRADARPRPPEDQGAGAARVRGLLRGRAGAQGAHQLVDHPRPRLRLRVLRLQDAREGLPLPARRQGHRAPAAHDHARRDRHPPGRHRGRARDVRAHVAALLHARDAHALQRGHHAPAALELLPPHHDRGLDRGHLRHAQALRLHLQVRTVSASAAAC